ncbi:hypothetical protein GQ457_07G007780 [Hibiscus cannabinus]
MVKAMRSYWWTRKHDEWGWPLIAWNTICQHKDLGELGKVLEATRNDRASYAWKSIHKAMHTIRPGLFWRIGINIGANIHEK